MSTIRLIEPEKDWPIVKGWWRAHGAIACPDAFLPAGWILSAGSVDVAAAFLYLDAGGRLAMVEYLTTNPAVGFSRQLVEDVKTLLFHVEQAARAQGCTGIISMVAPGTGEERLMRRMGYLPPDGPAHLMFCKRLEG